LTEPYYDEDGITIYHGDCREIDAWDIAGGVMVTDPPYGIAVESCKGGALGRWAVAGDADSSVRDWTLNRWAPRPALVFGSWKVPRPANVRACLTWDKGDNVGMGDLRIPWMPNTEEIYVIGGGFQGKRTTAVLRCHAVAGHGFHKIRPRNHPTEKPLSLMAQLVAKCPPLAVIVDPFMGSGTTLRAAKNLGRAAIGIECEERYCEIAARRLAQGVLPL
jgi:DNA modification methylase